jgi:hypothetical protein
LDAELNVIQRKMVGQATLYEIQLLDDDGFCIVNEVGIYDHDDSLYRVYRYDRNLNLMWTEDVTANFIINRNAGTLTVTKREITIEAADLIKPFDGTPLEALSGMDAIKDNAMLNWLNTLEGNNFVLEVTEVEGSIFFVGSTDSVIKKVKITWNGEDVTSSFIPTINEVYSLHKPFWSN